MTTARLLSGPPLVEIVGGLRTLKRDLKVDLGQRVGDLIVWDVLRQQRDGGPRFVKHGRGGSTIVTIPAGLRYDGASLPSGVLVRLLAGPKERYEVAAALHDAFYLWGAPREASDLAFWIVSRSGEERVNRFRGWAAWIGLRAGGWLSYWRHRRRQKAREARAAERPRRGRGS